MIDLKKLKSNAEYLEKACDGAYVELPTADVLELISLLEQAQKDAARLDWLTSEDSCFVESHPDGYYVVHLDRSDDGLDECQEGFFDNPRAAIDAAMQSEKGV